jgi:hypothetical protein
MINVPSDNEEGTEDHPIELEMEGTADDPITLGDDNTALVGTANTNTGALVP